MQLNKRKLCKRKFLSGSNVATFLNCTYLKSQLIFDNCFFRVRGMLYLLCCAINMSGVNPGGQKAQGKPRLAGPGVFWLQSEMPLNWKPGPSSSSEMGRGEDSTVSVLLTRGTAARAPLTEHNARELFYGGPRPCGELAIALATGNWLARKAAN